MVTLADVQAQIDADAHLVRHALRSRARVLPGLTYGISVPASTLRRDCPKALVPLISGLPMPPAPATPPFRSSRLGAQVIPGRRPGASLRGHEEGNGEPPAGRTGRSRPRSIPRRTDHQNSPRLRRPRPAPRHPADTRPTARQHLRTPAPRTHPRPANRRRTTTLQARPGHRGQGLQLPRLPRLPTQTRHRTHHPGEDRPATAPSQPRTSRRPTTGIRPASLPSPQRR